MKHVERLEQAGILDIKDLTDEHKQIMNSELTEEEVDVIIRIGKKLSGHPQGKKKKVGCTF